MVQIRRLLHQTMPGFADLFEDGQLFHKSIALAIALHFSSAESIRQAGVAGIASPLSKTKIRDDMAENLIKCHAYYRSLSALWMQRKVDPRDRRCRIANRAMRMVYQLVGGRQLWRGKSVDREYLLAKLQEFHRVHETPIDQAIRDLNEAFAWLPKSVYAGEAKPLAELARKKRRGLQRVGDLMISLLIRLGVPLENNIESPTSKLGVLTDLSCCLAR
jgi:hypothetical protein